VGKIEETSELDKWHSTLIDYWKRGMIPLPKGVPEDYAFHVYLAEARDTGDEAVIVILAGHNLGPDLHNSRSYHWAGLYAFNKTGYMLGCGWWSASPDRFDTLIHRLGVG